MQVALTLFPGVSADECEAFTLAFERLPNCELVGVGHEIGDVVGPGGRQHVDAVFGDVPRPDVVLVPGGLGVDRTAHDSELVGWLRRVEPTCQWMAASSTGTVVVAAAGLLAEHDAATHWLAGPMLAQYGSDASPERIVEVGHVLTCHGRVSAIDVALLMILRLHNREVARRVKREMAEAQAQASNTAAPPSWMSRLSGSRLARLLRTARLGPGVRRRPRNQELQTSDWIEMELSNTDDHSESR